MKNNYRIYGDLTVISIKHKGLILYTMIDTVDLRRVASVSGSWYAVNTGNGNKMYVTTQINGVNVYLHRHITVAPKGLVVDHIDGDGLNNRRRSNLRVVTSAENAQNRQGANANSTTKIRGVGWHKRHKKWQVKVNVNGVQTWIGAYEKLEDAEQAGIDARTKHYAFSKENLGVEQGGGKIANQR